MIDILLVDDDEDQLALMRLVLQREFADASALAVRSGEQALSVIAASGARPRLVLVDVKMPGMDGPATVRRLRAAGAGLRCPIVMLSTSGTPEDIRACLDAGANSYVRKPLTLEQWSRTIRGVASYWFEFDRSADAA